jgi:hypothetical protein
VSLGTPGSEGGGLGHGPLGLRDDGWAWQEGWGLDLWVQGLGLGPASWDDREEG